MPIAPATTGKAPSSAVGRRTASATKVSQSEEEENSVVNYRSFLSRELQNRVDHRRNAAGNQYDHLIKLSKQMWGRLF